MPGDDSTTGRATRPTSWVRNLFDRVAPSYDTMNDLMSVGWHRIWKRDLVGRIPVVPHIKMLDVAGGTGDIALAYMEKSASLVPQITVLDPSDAMLTIGRNKAIDRNVWSITWRQGSAESIPFPDYTFDVCTISFGLRNVTDVQQALFEMHRVLKPGGQLLCLEFSQPDPDIETLYRLYTLDIIPKIGHWVAHNEDAYRYLGESIQQFYSAEALKDLLYDVGFQTVQVTRRSKGIVAMHQAWKTEDT